MSEIIFIFDSGMIWGEKERVWCWKISPYTFSTFYITLIGSDSFVVSLSVADWRFTVLFSANHTFIHEIHFAARLWGFCDTKEIQHFYSNGSRNSAWHCRINTEEKKNQISRCFYNEMPQTHTRHFRVVRKHNLSVILEMLFRNASVDGKMCHLICVLLSYCRNINFQTFVHWVTNKSIHYVARAEKLFFEIPSTIFCATLKRIWLYCMRNATSKGEKKFSIL